MQLQGVTQLHSSVVTSTSLHGQHLKLLQVAMWSWRRTQPTDQKRQDEKFVCRMYNVSDIVCTTNETRLLLFGKLSSPESLPPTSDAHKENLLPKYGVEMCEYYSPTPLHMQIHWDRSLMASFHQS